MSGPVSSPDRVFLHVGLHKTGTTHLQNLMRQNRKRLARRRGIYVPPGPRKTIFATLDLIPRHGGLARDVRVSGAWDSLVAEVRGCGRDTAVVSEERLSLASPQKAHRAVSSFPDSEVHVIVTVRDLPRVVVSHWQEDIKHGYTWTLDEYAGALADRELAGADPARRFWLHEDVTGILNNWGKAVPAERIHVVTVPPPGSPPDLLAARFGSVVGFGDHDLPRRGSWSNENVGAVGTELLRRLNERLEGRLDDEAYALGVKVPMAAKLAAMPDRRPTMLNEEQHTWACAESARLADEVQEAGYRVVGDLSDLRPRVQPASLADPAGHHADITDSELLDAALVGMAELSARHGTWVASNAARSAAESMTVPDRWTRFMTHVRSRAFSLERDVADLAVRTRPGRRLAAAHLRRRLGR